MDDKPTDPTTTWSYILQFVVVQVAFPDGYLGPDSVS